MKEGGTWMLRGLTMWFALISVATAQPESDKDSLLKAAFIFKFTKFIRWPGDIKQRSLVLCTLGKDELAHVIKMNAGDIGPNQTMIVQPIYSQYNSAVIDNCHVLYIAKSEQGSYRSLDIISRNQALLTISELPGFMQSGGVVELGYEANKLRFDINLDAAHLKGLEISSGLLKLARQVKWDSKP